MVELILMNGARVEVSQEEVKEFITQIVIPNPDWHHSGLLAPGEYMSYLMGKICPEVLRRVARYFLIYEENLAFTAFLFDKAEGNPDQTKEFNMPALKKLREIFRRVIEDKRTPEELAGDVHEMENVCLETGADPL